MSVVENIQWRHLCAEGNVLRNQSTLKQLCTFAEKCLFIGHRCQFKNFLSHFSLQYTLQKLIYLNLLFHFIPIPMVYIFFINGPVYSRHRKKVYTCIKVKYSKARGTREKVGGAPHPPLSWSKVDQVSFWNSRRWRHRNNFFKFQYEAWSVDALYYIQPPPPQLGVLGSAKVCTFFWGRLYIVLGIGLPNGWHFARWVTSEEMAHSRVCLIKWKEMAM